MDLTLTMTTIYLVRECGDNGLADRSIVARGGIL
jgi:hypothetical protein